ncbi:MAG: ArnT family glycosyltransferase, partial [Anaerolineae bacterium]
MSLQDWGLLVIGFGGIIISASGYGALLLSIVQRCFNKKLSLTSSEETFLSLPIGLGICSLLLLLVGLSGGLYPNIGWALTITGVAVWGILKLQHLSRPHLDKTNRSPSFSILSALLMILWTGEALYTLISHAFMPPHEWDEVAYHLALAKLYVSFHKIIYIPFIVQSNWPLNTEMLFSWGLLLGSDVISHLITWFMSVWTTYGLCLLGKNFLNERIGRLSAALFLTVPLVKRLSGTGLIDVSLPFYGTAALYCYCKYTQQPSLGWVILCGLVSGFAAGSKLTGAAYIFLFCVLLILEFAISKRDKQKQLVTASIVFVVVSLVTVSPWYIRSWVFTGNPFWPFFFEIFGGKNWDRLGTQNFLQGFEKTVKIVLPRNLWGLLSSLWYLFVFPHYLGGYRGGIGFVPLLLFVPAS